MKNTLVFAFFCLVAFSFVSCLENPEQNSKQIDTVAEDAKNFLDKFSTKAKELLEGDEIDKIKDVIDEIAVKSKDIEKDSRVWREKLEEIKNDKEVQRILKKHEGDAEEIFQQIETIFEDISQKLEE